MAASWPLYRPNVCASEQHQGSARRGWLKRLFRYFSWIIAVAVMYVLLDFSIDFRPLAVHSSYHFQIPALQADEVRILRQDNLSIVVIRRSAATRRRLEQTAEALLQDPGSRRSHQPGYAQNPLRSRHAEFFVAYATGTDLGCLLQEEEGGLRESCGDARYDAAGRALSGMKSFPNLSIPDYTFANNFSSLTVNP